MSAKSFGRPAVRLFATRSSSPINRTGTAPYLPSTAPAATVESGPRAARGPARDSEAPAPAVLPEAGNAKRSLRADREGASARLPTRMPTACPRRRRRTGPSWWAPLGLGRSSPQFILTRDVDFGRSIRTRSEWQLLVDCVDLDPDVADMPVRCGLPRRSSSDGGRAP